MEIDNILKYFPIRIAKNIEQGMKTNPNGYQLLEEIRIRLNKPILLKVGQEEIILPYIPNKEEIAETMQRLCESSIYSYQNQIKNGYITIKGGHRVGITGSAVIKENEITNLIHTSSLNFRIARQVLGCSKEVLPYILDKERNSIYNTLIVSAPGIGKTTILRDLIRNISNGIEEDGYHGITVSVIDERGEIAGMYKGVAQNDIGMRTDVIDDVPKAIGMKMAIRSMSPKVIVADEIGSKEDAQAICYAVRCGVKGIFTAHGSSVEELSMNPSLQELLEAKVIERVILIKSRNEKGLQKSIYELNREEQKYKLLFSA